MTEQTYTAFADFQRHLFTGENLADVVSAAQQALSAGSARCVVLFEDHTGVRLEIDHPDQVAHVFARFAPEPPPAEAEAPSRPGRPRLGVVAREVSLLPRHWEWLAGQRGGASAAMRRLVDEARTRHAARDADRAGRDAVFQFLSAVCGDLPGFEEAARALYSGDFAGLEARVAEWPADLRGHAVRLSRRAAMLHAAAERERQQAAP